MGLDMYLIKKKKDKNNKDSWGFEDKDELIYWRKTNCVHKYFCDNGKLIEEEREYTISKQNLQGLLNLCNTILKEVKTKNGKIKIGEEFKDGEWVPILKDGIVVENPEICEDLLPTKSGFFFGSTEYDEYYLDDIRYTRDRIELILKTLDFDTNDLLYLASW